LTIGPAVDFHIVDLHHVENELKELISSLNRDNPFKLQKKENEFVSYLGENKDSVVLRFQANEIVKMFHTLIISRINSIGIGTRKLRSHLQSTNDSKD
jgi:hypothetical protein